MQGPQLRVHLAEVVNQAELQRRRAVMEEYSHSRLRQLFWINPDIATAVVVATNIPSLSDGVPYVAVTRKSGPVVDVNACVAKIPFKTMAVI